MTGSMSAEKTRKATGLPRWKPKINATSRNAGAVSQKPQPSSPFMRFEKKATKLPSVLK